MTRLHLLLLLVLVFLQCVQANENRDRRAAVYTTATLWDLNIPFMITDEFTEDEKQQIRAGIRSVESHTCINFTENGSGKKLEYNRRNVTGCFAYPGNISFFTVYQPVNLGAGCLTVRTIQHETIHALGFAHTHMRTDRDGHIRIDFSKIDPEWHDQYDKLGTEESATNYGIPYEFNSVMHYQDTNAIESMDGGYAKTVGGVEAIFNDWKIINIHYKCNETCPAPANCLNGGYQNPRDCDNCVCPQFHRGALCAESTTIKLSSLGDTHNVYEKFDLDKSVVNNETTHSFMYVQRTAPTIIEAPHGYRINVTIHSILDQEIISAQECPSRCDLKALEIVDGDLTRVGKRFCCKDHPEQFPYTFTSKTNVIGYRIFTRPGLDFAVNAEFAVVEEPSSNEHSTTERTVSAGPDSAETQASTVNLSTDETTRESITDSNLDSETTESSIINIVSTEQTPGEIVTGESEEPETTVGSEPKP